MNQSEYELLHVADSKHGEIQVRLGLVLFLGIAWENGASFVNRPQSEVMQNLSKQELLLTLGWNHSVFCVKYP